MEELRIKAHEKMLEEMKDNKSPITERLHVWLCNCEDEEMLNGIIREDKNINKATEYLYAQGSKLAVKGVADISAEQEFTWCREYYLKDKIDKKDLKILPPAAGEKVEVIKEVVREVKEVIYETPTADAIAEYLAQQKQNKVKDKSPKLEIEQESLF